MMTLFKKLTGTMNFLRNRKQARTVRGVLVGLAAALAISLLYLAGTFASFERMSADWRRTTFVPAAKSGSIVNVTISQHCLNSMQEDFDYTWPWPREIYGGMVDYLKRHGAGAILFDMIFSEFSHISVHDDRKFIEEIRKTGSVFLTASFLNSDTFKEQLRGLRADIPQQLAVPLFEDVLKKVKNAEDRELLRQHYRKNADGSAHALVPETRYPVRVRLNTILTGAGVLTKSLQAVLAEIRKVDKLDRFKLPVTKVEGSLPVYANMQAPPYEEYLPVITGLGNVWFEEDPDGIGRRKTLLFRNYGRYFPDLSLAAVNHILRVTNIVRSGREIILGKDRNEIDAGMYSERILPRLDAGQRQALEAISYPLPPAFLTPAQLDSARKLCPDPAAFDKDLKLLYTRTSWTNLRDAGKVEELHVLVADPDLATARRFQPHLDKARLFPQAWRLAQNATPEQMRLALAALDAAGYRDRVRIPVDPEGKMPIKFYGEFFSRSEPALARIISAAMMEQLEKKLSKEDLALLRQYYTPQADGDWRKKPRLTDPEERLVRFLMHRGGFFPNFTLSIRAYDLVRAASRPEFMQALKIHPDMFRNKTILIGSTAPGLMDLRANPFNKKDPGFYLYTSTIENIINQDFLIEGYNPLLTILIILILCLLTGLAGTRLAIFRGILVTLSLGLAYALMTVLLFTQTSTLIDLATVELAVVLTFLAGTVANYINENKQKSFIQGAFSQILAPAILDKLMEDPSTLGLGGEEKELTIFFSDLQGFTSLSEELGSPTKLVEILNEYLTAMSDIIMNYDGYVDKYEGDAIMAFWGAPLDDPDHAWKACYAALENQEKIHELQARFREMGLTSELKVRVGMNTGIALVGMMGSLKKLNYTIIGDSVNLASRLEGANKQYGTFTMVSESTYLLAKDRIIVRPLDLIRVKGKKEPTSVYELMAKAGGLDTAGLELVATFTRGVTAYRQRQFAEAVRLFEQCDTLRPGDPPSQVYLDRCRQYLVTPPEEGWDGVFTMTTK